MSWLESLKPEEVSASLKNSEILVADDSRLMRVVLKKALLELGFINIAEACYGREAIEKLME